MSTDQQIDDSSKWEVWLRREAEGGNGSAGLDQPRGKKASRK